MRMLLVLLVFRTNMSRHTHTYFHVIPLHFPLSLKPTNVNKLPRQRCHLFSMNFSSNHCIDRPNLHKCTNAENIFTISKLMLPVRIIEHCDTHHICGSIETYIHLWQEEAKKTYFMISKLHFLCFFFVSTMRQTMAYMVPQHTL